jgi:phage-related tail protein
MGNRVEDLERQVAELQAAVDGLTEELVETKERLNQLESATDADVESESSSRSGNHVEFVPNRSADEHAADDGQTADQTDAGKPAETKTDDESGDDSDDIIVA